MQPGPFGLRPKSVIADEMAAARRPSARLLLIRRLPPSSDMLSSDGALEPRPDVSGHQNQTHLFANAIICQTQQEVRRPPLSLSVICVVSLDNHH